MPKYKITDPVSGRAVTVSGDAPPSQSDAEGIFSAAGLRDAPPTAEAAPEKTSQALGVEKGATKVFDNAALTAQWLLGSGIPNKLIPSPGNVISSLGSAMGMPSAEQAEAKHKASIAERAKTQGKPGAIGELGGEMLGTLPLASLGLGPAAGAGLAAFLSSDKKNPGDLAIDTGVGALGGKAIDLGVKALAKPARTVAGKAYDYVTNLAGKAKKTPEDIAKAGKDAFDKPLTGAEAIGRQGKTALTAIGRREGETADNLEGMLTERQLGARDRILDDFSSQVGVDPGAAKGNMEGIVAKGKVAAKPFYEAAFARPATSAMWTPRLQEFLDQPETRAGLARGLQIQRLEAVSEGRPFNPSDYAIRGIEPDGTPIIGWSRAETLKRGGTLQPGQTDIPNLRTMDAVKRGLDAMINDYRDKITGRLVLDEKGKALDGFRRSYVKELDKVAPPEYAQARSTASDYLSAQESFDRGQKAILDTRLTERQFVDNWVKLSEPEREAQKGGIANKLFELAQNGRLKPGVLNTPRIQAKLGVAFGPQKAQEFVNRLKVEADMAAAANRMKPGTGSVTAEVLEAGKDQGEHYKTAIEAARALGHAASGNHIGFLANAWALLKKAGAFGQTAGMNTDVRDEVGRLLMMSPADLSAYLKTTPLGHDPESMKAFQELVQKARKVAPTAGALASQPLQDQDQ